MAFEQTKIIHGEEEADKALSAAKAMFGSHKVVSTEGLPFITLEKDRLEEGIGAIELFAMTDLCTTNGDARRLISQGGASINDKKLGDIKIVIDSTWLDEEGFLLLKAGKKRYFKVIVE